LDNLTHTLIGALVGETAARITSSNKAGLEPARRRDLLVTVAAVSSNLPDLDFIYSAITRNKLAYLLQHRGFTHTVIGLVIAAAVTLLACEGWCRWRRWNLARSDRLQLGGIALLTLLLHVAMDFANSYGVHPFWPFYNGWLYGDSIFIVEPLLWAAAAPLTFLFRSLAARVLVALALVAGIGLGFGSGLMPATFALILTMVSIAMLVIGYRAAPRTALFAGIALWIAVTAIFAAAHGIAKRQMAGLTARQFEGAQLLDNVLTPMPSNPVCWDSLLLLVRGDEYMIWHATWSIAPSVIAADACPTRMVATEMTAPNVAVPAANDASVHWWGEVAMPRDQIAKLAATNCEAAAFLRFARAPWSAQQDGRTVIGDLRYDREAGLGFAELALQEETARCPQHVPPWTPPREDLIRENPVIPAQETVTSSSR
jgi:inner membrane protein